MLAHASEIQNTQNFITESRGVGVTVDAALKDALSQAVQQAAGALVDSQTLMKNDEIMQEQVLTCSDGIVKSFERLSEPKQNKQGLWTIKIKAVVQQKILRQKLIDSKILVVKVDAAKNFWAEMTSAAKNEKDAIPFIKKFLDNIDVKQYLYADFIDKDGNRGANVAPCMIRLDNNNARLSIGVIISIDSGRFQKEVALPFCQVLEYIAEGKDGPVVFHDSRGGQKELLFLDGKFFPRDNYNRNGTPVPGGSYKYCYCRAMGSGFSGKADCDITINVSSRYNPSSQSFVRFRFPTFMERDITTLFEKKIEEIEKISVCWILLDKDNQEVSRTTISPMKPSGGELRCIIMGTNISPEFRECGSDYSNTLFLGFTTKLSVDELKDITSMKLEVK